MPPPTHTHGIWAQAGGNQWWDDHIYINVLTHPSTPARNLGLQQVVQHVKRVCAMAIPSGQLTSHASTEAPPHLISSPAIQLHLNPIHGSGRCLIRTPRAQVSVDKVEELIPALLLPGKERGAHDLNGCCDAGARWAWPRTHLACVIGTAGSNKK